LIPPIVDSPIGLHHIARQAFVLMQQRRQRSIDGRIHPITQAEEIGANRLPISIEFNARHE
jgi:hypothetical protein